VRSALLRSENEPRNVVVTGVYVSAFSRIVIVSEGDVSALFFRAYWRLRWLREELLAALLSINELKW
jgi:hypothetical protein